MPGEVALVGEASGVSRLRKRGARGDHRLCSREPLSDLEPVRRGAEGRAEVAAERKPVEAAHPFQLL
jgi:hypothetical protein